MAYKQRSDGRNPIKTAAQRFSTVVKVGPVKKYKNNTFGKCHDNHELLANAGEATQECKSPPESSENTKSPPESLLLVFFERLETMVKKLIRCPCSCSDLCMFCKSIDVSGVSRFEAMDVRRAKMVPKRRHRGYQYLHFLRVRRPS